MRQSSVESAGFVAHSGRRTGRARIAATVAATLTVGTLVIVAERALRPGPSPSGLAEQAANTAGRATPASRHEPLFDPRFSLGPAPLPLSRSAPLSAEMRPAAPRTVAALEPPARPKDLAGVPAATPPLPAALQVVDAPLPLPRPPGLRATQAAPQPRLAAPQMSRRARVAATAPAEKPDDRSFLERLFGIQRAPDTPLAYAPVQDEGLDRSRARRLGLVAPAPAPAQRTATAGTAIYDISARMVYLPNGDKLEAHSGLGEKMDDPRFVHVRMHGATPPHVYELTEREALFHGVRALRLNPVGGSGAIHGRAGLLAHSYLLGPRGDSNGCVSFKDYDRFLQAFLKGEIRRLVVVAGAG